MQGQEETRKTYSEIRLLGAERSHSIIVLLSRLPINDMVGHVLSAGVVAAACDLVGHIDRLYFRTPYLSSSVS